MRLGIGRDDRPRRPRRSGRGDRLAVRLLVGVPAGALLEVADRELPVLGRVVEPVLQALALLVLRDVEEELEDDGAGLDEQLLEGVDVGEALRRLVARDPALDDRNEDVLVVAAVEDHDLAGGRRLLVDAPQEVVRALLLGRRLPRRGADAERAGFREHATDRAVLAARVGALQDDEHLEAAIGVQHVLEPVDVARERVDGGLVDGLVAARKGLAVRIDRGEIEAPGALRGGRRLALAGRLDGRRAGVLEVREARAGFLRHHVSAATSRHRAD